MKFCNKCKESKVLTNFYKDKTHKDGFSSFCKPCKLSGNNISRLKHIDRDKQHKKEYYQKNKEHFYKLSRKWVEANPEQNRIYKRKYKYNNRSLMNEWDKKRYEKEQLAMVWADRNLLEQIFVNCPVGYEVDHIIPLNHKIMSGLNIPENLRYLPKKENGKKNNKLDSELKFKLNPLDWKDIIG